jgi:hypothetical protein
MTTKPIPKPVCRESERNPGRPVYVVSCPTGYMAICVRDTEVTAAERESDDKWAMPGFERQDCWDRIVLHPEDAIELARVLVDCATWILDHDGSPAARDQGGDR